jgi:hypothetical protein
VSFRLVLPGIEPLKKELSFGLRKLNDREKNERNGRKGDEIERHGRSVGCLIANGASIWKEIPRFR